MNVKSFFSSETSFTNLGLLILRVGIGSFLMIFHGYGKLMGGPERWERLGGQMQNFGIDFFPVFWGFMAMFSEFFCAFLVILGVLFRPATAFIVITMLVAASRHLSLPPEAEGSGWGGAAHALEFMFVFLALFFAGPGEYRFSLLRKK